MVAELKSLRAQCAGIIAKLDLILAECDAPEAVPGQPLPLLVEGICHAITHHAIERFRERTGCKRTDDTICGRVRARLANADEMVLKPKFRLIEKLSHDTPARYFRHHELHELLFVVERGLIVTVHHGTADRWVPKPAAGAEEGA